MTTRKPIDRRANTVEETELRERATLMLAAFERAEPGPMWAQLRQVLDRTKGVRGLRVVLRELRGMGSGLAPVARQELDQALRDRFGPDASEERDLEIVARVQRRGHIRSEGEYRVVQAHADTIAADPARQAEFLALGALVDAYMAAP